MGFLGGVLVAIVLWIKSKKYFHDYQFIVFSLSTCIVSYIMLVQFKSPPPAPLFFIGTFLLSFSFFFFFPSMESFYTKRITELHHETQGINHPQ